MWSIEESVVVRAPPDQVFPLWKDVPGWTRWDKSLEWGRLDGDFKVGSKGQFKQKGGPKISFTLTQVDPPRGFTAKVRMPLATMNLIHRAEAQGDGTRVTHRIELEGPLSGLFSMLLGKNLRQGLPHTTEGIAALVGK